MASYPSSFPVNTFFDDDVWKKAISSSSSSSSSSKFVGALDQGTSSTRFVVFEVTSGALLCYAQCEHTQYYPAAGWHEHDALEIIRNCVACMRAVQDLWQQKAAAGAGGGNNSSSSSSLMKLACLGITNQRETCVAFNKRTGLPYHRAIVWDDARTADTARNLPNQAKLRARTGLPASSYFAGTKMKWLLDHVHQLQQDVRDKPDEVCFGTIDTWLVYQLTGQRSPTGATNEAFFCGGPCLTDVTNASRWLFMDLKTLQFSQDLVDAVCAPHTNIPASKVLPTICPSSHMYGICSPDLHLSLLTDVPITGVLGDQQAALFGQTAFAPGQAKNTYGTGMFLMMNTGTTPIASTHGLLTTVAYQLGPDEPPNFALEGSVAFAGSTIQWLRDQLGIIRSAGETEILATQTGLKGKNGNDGLYLVPAFGGLFCPHWRPDARACLVGLTAAHDKGHVCRAALQAMAFQTAEVLHAMQADCATSNLQLAQLKVDGGASANRFLMQFQANILGVDVIQPVVQETTSLGAAFCAGLHKSVGVWKSTEELQALWAVQRTFTPNMEDDERQRLTKEWNKAVTKSLAWVEENIPVEIKNNEKNKWNPTAVLVVALGALALGFSAGRTQRK